MKQAVYFSTPNFYRMMCNSAKSMLSHTPMDKIFFMIDEDTLPSSFGKLPSCIECVNVSGQQYFPHDGPNYQSAFSHMILLRVVLPLILPEIDTILSIDADTLIQDDISEIWQADISDRYFAAVRELPHLHKGTYYNIGVAIMNLQLMREGNIPERATQMLNAKRYCLPEQDVLNELCRDHIRTLPARYNYAKKVTAQSPGCVIRHYLGRYDKENMRKDMAVYDDMSWTEAIRKGELNHAKD